jgi:transposase
MQYIGIDYHKQYSFATSIDSETGEKKMAKLANTPAAYEAFITRPRESHVVFEASRTWPVIYDLLKNRVGKVTMAHPLRVKAIASARIKTDKIDSDILAKLLAADLIPEAHIRDSANRSRQVIIRQRVFFVESRTRVKNRIHVLIDRQPDQVRKQVAGLTDLFGKTGMEWLRHHAPLSGNDGTLLKHLLHVYDALTEVIRYSDKQINHMYRNDLVAQLLGTIPGIGKFLAVVISVEIDDIARFTSADTLASYTGLIPSTRSSGGITRHGRIIKQGNKWLRWAFVEAAVTAKKSNAQLNEYYTAIYRRKGTSKARNALARRLVKIAYSMITHNRTFQPYMKSGSALYTS